MNEKTTARVIKLGIFGAAAVGLLGLQATQANADGWGEWAAAGSWATCSQSFGQAIGTQYEALTGYSLATGSQLKAIPPCNQGTLDPAQLASGRTKGLGYPYYNNNQTTVEARAGTQTQTVNAPGSLSHSICQVSGFNVI